MSSLSDFLGGGGGGGATGAGKAEILFWTSSGTYTFPQAGTVDIYAIGGGGGGGSNPYSSATGGGAGGTAVAEGVTVTANDTIVLVAGAGGDGGLGANSVMPNAGGTTTVNSNNISGFTTLTANGGGAGSSNYNNTLASGATGGTGSGGNRNHTGGGSGDAQVNGTYYNCYAATGGGAPGLNRDGYSSGNATVNTSNGYSATAGAGLGGGTPDAGSSQRTNGASAFRPGELLNSTENYGTFNSLERYKLGGSFLGYYDLNNTINRSARAAGAFSSTGGVSAPSSVSNQNPDITPALFAGGAVGIAADNSTAIRTITYQTALAGGSPSIRINTSGNGGSTLGGILGGGGGAYVCGSNGVYGAKGGVGGVIVVYNA